jgi:hypothetical protein
VTFGGGKTLSGYSSAVDVFDLCADPPARTHVHALSEARADLAAASVGPREVMFVGGAGAAGASSAVDRVALQGPPPPPAAAAAATKIDPIVCDTRCIEAGAMICEGFTSACNLPSCAMGCEVAAGPGGAAIATAAACAAACAQIAAAGSCTPSFANQTYQLCGTCPHIEGGPTCPAAGACALGCALAFGGPVPRPPTPPPTPPPPPLLPCTSDYNCSFNGACDASTGACACDKAWAGSYCQQLNLLPVVNGSGLNQLADPAARTSTWGGAVLHDAAEHGGDGKWHMFASEIERHCGIHRWVTNSVVVHAVADAPDGVYTKRAAGAGGDDAVLFPIFTHEPAVVRVPTGEWALYVTHHDGPPTDGGWGDACNCTSGASASGGCAAEVSNCHDAGDLAKCAVYTWRSISTKGAAGPWGALEPIPSIQPGGAALVDTNFAPLIEADGSLLAWTRGSIVRSNDWRNLSGYKDTGGGLRPGLGFGIGEDPFLWKDAKGRYHILSHNGDRGAPGDHGDCGRHFFSASGDAGTWDAAPLGAAARGGCAYFRDGVRFADGSLYTFFRRERPHLVFGADGSTIVALTTSAIDSPTSPNLPGGQDGSYTLLQPVNH